MSTSYVFLSSIETAQIAGVNRREAWMPKGDRPYYDPVAQRTFQSRADKRAWLTRHGMREAGELLNPEQAIRGREKTRLSPERQRAHQMVQQHIKALGGVNGLLDRLERKRRQGG